MDLAGGVISVITLTGKLVSYVTDIKAAPTELSRYTTEFSNFGLLLTQLQNKLKDADPSKPWFAELRELGRQGGEIAQLESLLQALVEKIDQSTKMKKLKSRLFWTLEKEEIATILLRMSRVTSAVHTALLGDLIELAKAAEEDGAEVKASILDLKRSMRNIEGRDADEERLGVLNWIDPIDYSVQQADKLKEREKDTGLWFLDSPEFQLWLDGNTDNLFCPGIPGSGKTIMAATVIDYLSREFMTKGFGLGFFYFNYKTTDEQKTDMILSAIVKQILLSQREIPQSLRSAFETKRRLNVDDLARILKEILSKTARTFIVIDALDEFSDSYKSKELLRILRRLQLKAKVSVMVTSRFIPDIESNFEKSVKLEVRASDDDIRKYVTGRMDRMPNVVRRSTELQQKIQSGIIVAVDGMFLLARLFLKSLYNKHRHSEITSAIDRLIHAKEPLEEAYDQVIDRIGDCSLAIDAISWLTYAFRPLKVNELCHFLAVSIGDYSIDKENIPHIDDVISVCAGLVTVDERSSIVRLVHYTTQEYIERVREKWLPRARHYIGLTSLSCLTQDQIISTVADWRGYWKELQLFARPIRPPIILSGAPEYVRRFTVDHLIQIQLEERLNIMKLLRHSFDVRQRRGEVIHVAVMLRLEDLLRDLLDASPEIQNLVNIQDFHGCTPLHIVVGEGLDRIMRLLLARSYVEPNHVDNSGCTPIAYAVESGDEEIVELLLKRADIDVNIPDKTGTTPLLRAIQSKNSKISQSLLSEKGRVDVNTPNHDEDFPLQVAVNSHMERTVEILLDHDATVDCRDKAGRTPLSIGVDSQSLTIVTLLAEHGADVNSRCLKGRSPLSYAAEHGGLYMLKWLLERRAELDSIDDSGRTPLFYAAERSDVGSVEMLILRGADVHVRDKAGRTALWLAAAKSSINTVILLLKNGARLDAADFKSRTPLSIAAEGGLRLVVSFLCERNADLNSRDAAGKTPLFYAIENGNIEAVSILLEYGADIYVHDVDGRTPLTLAKLKASALKTARCEQIVELLRNRSIR